MSVIARRKVKGRTYFYLEESVKRGGKWVKESLYLGHQMPELARLADIYSEFSANLKKKGIQGLTPPLTEFITRNKAIKLEQAARKKAGFLGLLPPGKRAEFIRRERITFITDSNAIEGSPLDYDLTEKAISGQKRTGHFAGRGFAITGSGREEQEALNLNKCLDTYEGYLKCERALSIRMILQLHFALLSSINGYEKYRGIWRPVNVMIRGSDHRFPHHSEVPALMEGLLGWHGKNRGLIHPVELAAKFHTKFTTIHPFADGNGRMARLLMNYILQSDGFPFTNIPFARRSAYMRTQAAGNKGDLKPFTLFLAEEIIKQGRKLRK
jgi:Fic family protein